MNEMTPTARWTITQPWRGIFGLIVTLGAMMIVTSCFDIEAYLGFFSLLIMSFVPTVGILAAGWQAQYPSTEGLPQPWKGFLLTGFVVLIGIFSYSGLLHFAAEGAPTPFITLQVVFTVCVTFALILAFGMWPFGKLSLPGKGWLTLILAYILGWLVAMLGNWSFLTHAKGFIESPVFKVPFYAQGGPFEAFAGIAPMGPIAWESLFSFIICSLVFLFCFLALQFWPFSKSPSLMKQPVMGIVVIIGSGILGYILHVIGVGALKIVPLNLVLYDVSFLFGLLMILFMFQMWPGRTLKSPVGGGFLNIVIAIIVGIIAYYGLKAFCISHFGAEGMQYPNNVFAMANLMLGLTFPAWAIYATCWDFWPLPPTPPPPESPAHE